MTDSYIFHIGSFCAEHPISVALLQKIYRTLEIFSQLCCCKEKVGDISLPLTSLLKPYISQVILLSHNVWVEFQWIKEAAREVLYITDNQKPSKVHKFDVLTLDNHPL